MGFIGSAPAYWFLKRFYPNAQGVPMPQEDPFKEKGISKLGTYFGPAIFPNFGTRPSSISGAVWATTRWNWRLTAAAM